MSIKRRGPQTTLGAQILFGEAKARLEQILELVLDFNCIASDIEEMGYGPLDDEDSLSGWPVPQIEVVQNRSMDVDDANILDPFWERGVVRPKTATPISKRRSSNESDKHRLGERSGWKCFYCRKSGDGSVGPDGRTWHVDHAYPLILGGDDLPDNLVLACATCNLGKLSKTASMYFEMLAARLGCEAAEQARAESASEQVTAEISNLEP